MFDIDLLRFLKENRLQQVDLIGITGLTPAAISLMVKRKRVKASTLRKLEERFGNLDKYMLKKKLRKAV